MENLFKEREPALHFLQDESLHRSDKPPLLKNVYNEYLSGIKITVSAKN